jgi:hypothetical protein
MSVYRESEIEGSRKRSNCIEERGVRVRSMRLQTKQTDITEIRVSTPFFPSLHRPIWINLPGNCPGSVVSHLTIDTGIPARTSALPPAVAHVRSACSAVGARYRSTWVERYITIYTHPSPVARVAEGANKISRAKASRDARMRTAARLACGAVETTAGGIRAGIDKLTVPTSERGRAITGIHRRG